MYSSLSGFNTSLQQVDERYAWINLMIKARHQVMRCYMELVGCIEDSAADLKGIKKKLTDFCETMIDYVSRGHFDLYPNLLGLIENASGRSLSISQRAMPRIEKTTDYLMKFNDRYCQNLTQSMLKPLRTDLGETAKCLEVRFRNEDRLIVGLHLVHTIVSSAGA